MASRQSIKVALDWTPNTIHTGLYVALEKGLYSKHNLDVSLLPPDAAYSKTPGKLLEGGEADLAVCPSESCIAYNQSGKMRLQAIYAILQKDASAIVSTSVGSMREMGDGKVYGSYNARYEDHIVRAMVGKDGGRRDGVRIKSSEGKLSLFEALKKGEVDATWVFMAWEGVEAALEGVGLHAFRTEDYGVPYGYSPVIARDAGAGKVSEEALKNFVTATREGYAFAMDEPAEAVAILGKHCEPARSQEFLRKSQQSINGFYGDGTKLGTMSKNRWETWVDWLDAEGLLDAGRVGGDALFTNAFA